MSGTVFKTDQRFLESLVRSTRTVFRHRLVKLIWLILAAALLLVGVLLYRSSSSDLNVTPDAKEAIDKAKQR